MSLLGGGGRGSKQIKPMSLYILFFFNDGFPNYVKLAQTSIFCLSVCLMKSNCYTLIYSSLVLIDYSTNHSYSFVFLSSTGSFLTAEIHHLFSSYSYRYLLEKILILIIIDLLWAFPKLTVLPGKRSRFYWAIL